MSDANAERWLPVVGYEGSYEVSDLGRVRSLDRVITDEFPGGRMRRRRCRICRAARQRARRARRQAARKEAA